jgi:hypothetical protein
MLRPHTFTNYPRKPDVNVSPTRYTREGVYTEDSSATLPARTTMNAPLKHFLLVFDHNRAELVRHENFGTDVKRAMAEYTRLEREHLDKSDGIEIVLIGSDSLETVKVTHANYFDGTVAVSKYFAGI